MNSDESTKWIAESFAIDFARARAQDAIWRTPRSRAWAAYCAEFNRAYEAYEASKGAYNG